MQSDVLSGSYNYYDNVCIVSKRARLNMDSKSVETMGHNLVKGSHYGPHSPRNVWVVEMHGFSIQTEAML